MQTFSFSLVTGGVNASDSYSFDLNTFDSSGISRDVFVKGDDIYFSLKVFNNGILSGNENFTIIFFQSNYIAYKLTSELNGGLFLSDNNNSFFTSQGMLSGTYSIRIELQDAEVTLTNKITLLSLDVKTDKVVYAPGDDIYINVTSDVNYALDMVLKNDDNVLKTYPISFSGSNVNELKYTIPKDEADANYQIVFMADGKEIMTKKVEISLFDIVAYTPYNVYLPGENIPVYYSIYPSGNEPLPTDGLILNTTFVYYVNINGVVAKRYFYSDIPVNNLKNYFSVAVPSGAIEPRDANTITSFIKLTLHDAVYKRVKSSTIAFHIGNITSNISIDKKSYHVGDMISIRAGVMKSTLNLSSGYSGINMTIWTQKRDSDGLWNNIESFDLTTDRNGYGKIYISARSAGIYRVAMKIDSSVLPPGFMLQTSYAYFTVFEGENTSIQFVPYYPLNVEYGSPLNISYILSYGDGEEHKTYAYVYLYDSNENALSVNRERLYSEGTLNIYYGNYYGKLIVKMNISDNLGNTLNTEFNLTINPFSVTISSMNTYFYPGKPVDIYYHTYGFGDRLNYVIVVKHEGNFIVSYKGILNGTDGFLELSTEKMNIYDKYNIEIYVKNNTASSFDSIVISRSDIENMNVLIGKGMYYPGKQINMTIDIEGFPSSSYTIIMDFNGIKSFYTLKRASQSIIYTIPSQLSSGNYLLTVSYSDIHRSFYMRLFEDGSYLSRFTYVVETNIAAIIVAMFVYIEFSISRFGKYTFRVLMTGIEPFRYRTFKKKYSNFIIFIRDYLQVLPVTSLIYDLFGAAWTKIKYPEAYINVPSGEGIISHIRGITRRAKKNAEADVIKRELKKAVHLLKNTIGEERANELIEDMDALELSDVDKIKRIKDFLIAVKKII